VLFGEINRLNRGALRKRMRRCHNRDQFILEERRRPQALVVDLAGDHGEVDLPFE
jgi:hypothetical protein